MRVEAQVVSKSVPEWANGRTAELDGKLILLLRSKPKLVWPRWWHRLGKRLNWRWLETYKGLDY